MRGELTEAVRAQRDDEPAVRGEVDEPGEERCPLRQRSPSRARASSHWSTMNTASAPDGAWASTSSGRAPGVTIWTRRPSRASAAATPARTSEDLPHPDGPTTARTPTSSSRRRHTDTSASRPKNASGIADVVRHQPEVGTRPRLAWVRHRRRRGRGPVAGSPSRARRAAARGRARNRSRGWRGRAGGCRVPRPDGQPGTARGRAAPNAAHGWAAGRPCGAAHPNTSS